MQPESSQLIAHAQALTLQTHGTELTFGGEEPFDCSPFESIR